MNKKDFELIAGTIMATRCKVKYYGVCEEEALNILAENFSEVLSFLNPRFNKEKFLKACGVDCK